MIEQKTSAGTVETTSDIIESAERIERKFFVPPANIALAPTVVPQSQYRPWESVSVDHRPVSAS